LSASGVIAGSSARISRNAAKVRPSIASSAAAPEPRHAVRIGRHHAAVGQGGDLRHAIDRPHHGERRGGQLVMPFRFAHALAQQGFATLRHD
jgi:hypothetical protein